MENEDESKDEIEDAPDNSDNFLALVKGLCQLEASGERLVCKQITLEEYDDAFMGYCMLYQTLTHSHEENVRYVAPPIYSLS